MRLYFGTSNPYKIREMAGILRPLGIPLNVTDSIEPEETGTTFDENALIKARAYGRHVGQRLADHAVANKKVSRTEAVNLMLLNRTYTISEDSGLVVHALGGLPGPWSARFDDCRIVDGKFVGHNSSGRSREEIDPSNNQRVLDMMLGVPLQDRAASLMLSLLVADANGDIVFSAWGESQGWIAERSAGIYGFGYDPIFATRSSFGHTWAEIDGMRKNLISHRRQALMQLSQWLAGQLLSHEESSL